jgi:eukaryotic-like serine/threonine-protein kinase
MSERDLFIAALNITAPAERSAWLDQECGGDAALRQRIDVLLQAFDKAGSLLEKPVVAVGPTIDEPITEGPGTVIGPYKLLEQIGEGGMGTVWMAQQQEPVKRVVAVKLIKPGMDSKQVLARFEAERQALALMDHPNIARVLDAGTTGTGRPYFVMDLVRGVPITKYCDEHRLTPRQRLELFIPVCQAVQHAHQKGIIHRDLKPSNVLVALYDDKPVPKVIDFGVAKAAGQSLTDKTLVTGFGAIVGTLEYMSPEQAEVNQLDIDTRSDVYSLGVLLYELLAGSPPFTRKELEKGGMLEMLRVIREQEPSKPSTKLSSSDALPTLSANRGTEPAKLTKLVRGELDWIVMKALEKDRNRRYETANGFAMDVQRYLADEPVQACPPSAWYRLRKFARRNKGRLTAAAVLGVALLTAVGTAAGSIGWAARDSEARRARLTGQMEQILKDVGRLEGEQKWLEAQAAVERAEAALAGGEADDAIRRRVGEVRRDLEFVAELDRIRQEAMITVDGSWNYARAVRDYAQAFHDYGVDVEQLPADEAVARLQTNPALAPPLASALDDWVIGLLLLGKDKPRWAPLVSVARALDPDPLRDRVRAMWGGPVTPEQRAELQRLAESIDVESQNPNSLALLAATLDALHLPDPAVRILRDGQYAHPGDFWLNFALGHRLLERHDAAGAARYDSVAVSLHPDSMWAHINLGMDLVKQGKVDEAVVECRRAVECDPKAADAHYTLGVALEKQGKLDAAIAECRKAIEFDPNCVPAHNNLAAVLRDQWKLDESIAECRKAIELDPNFDKAHDNLGLALADKGKLDEAILEYRKAIQLNWKSALAHSHLGQGLYDQGNLEEAVAEYRRAIELDPTDATTHCNFSAVLLRQGKMDEAAAECRRAIALDPNNAVTHCNLALALGNQGKLEEAVAEYRQAIRLKNDISEAHENLGVCLSRAGRLDEALAEFKEAIRIKPDNHNAHYNLGVVLRDTGRLDEAVTEFKEAIRLKQDRVDAYWACAEILATAADPKVRDGAQAVRLARKAIELAPSAAGSWQALGWALYCTGAWKDSIEAFHKSMDLSQGPKGGYSGQWFGLGAAHGQLGNKEEARTWYDKAVQWMEKNDPRNEELRRFRAEAVQAPGLNEKK